MKIPEIIMCLQGVSKTYQIEAQSVEALRGVSLEVKSGQMVAITGRSGSGKSTLLHIMGLLDTPSSGNVEIMGTNVSSLNDNIASLFRNSCIGLVFQMHNLLPEFSALENVMMPGLIAGKAKSETSDLAVHLLEAVEMAHRLQHRPAELSGGEQQRVAIARALLMKPPILLADEPTGNLDKKSSEKVQNLLFELCEKLSLSMLLVTHDIELARRLPSRVVMEDGGIAELGGDW